MGPIRVVRSRVGERKRRRQAQALSRAVSALAPDTRRAMLAAVEAEELIVGAYTDLRGRACPMLAAYRRGARAGVGDFPRAWDAFAKARRPRAASPRELEVLKALLQESLAGAASSGGSEAGFARSRSGPVPPASSRLPSPPERLRW
jgi:hypothetical protein